MRVESNGEREANAFCRELDADALLSDDMRAYDEARARGIEVHQNTGSTGKGRSPGFTCAYGYPAIDLALTTPPITIIHASHENYKLYFFSYCSHNV